jgi:hypothetical protein
MRSYLTGVLAGLATPHRFGTSAQGSIVTPAFGPCERLRKFRVLIAILPAAPATCCTSAVM